jgi:ATP-dependent DNA helicase DinG
LTGRGTLREQVRRVFAPGGALQRSLPGFEPRPGQLRLAESWADAIVEGRVLVAEAATGIGKTLAYLVPAILSGGKTLVATGTKTLQQQLVDNDIPMLRSAIDIPFSYAVLKGRGNYLCRVRWKRFSAEPLFEFAREARWFDAIAEFAAVTRSGDISECEGVPDDLRAWHEINSRSDTCDPSACAESDRCFLVAARRRAAEADLVVANHHLFFADLALRGKVSANSDSVRRYAAELLPPADIVVLDEAHGIEEAAASFFGITVTSGRALELCRDLRRAGSTGIAPEGPSGQLWRPVLPATEAFQRAADAFFASVTGEGRALIPAPGKNPRFHSTARAMAEFGEELALLLHEGPVAGLPGGDALRDAESLHRRVRALVDDCAAVLEPDPVLAVSWAERRGHAVTLCRTPVEIARTLEVAMWDQPPPTLLASATLSVAGDLSYFKARVGLATVAAADLIVDNEFDFAEQSLAYVPKGLPDPSDPGFPAAAGIEAARVIRLSGGGALVLCTSYRGLSALSQALRRELPGTVLVQGEAPRPQLLRAFRDEEDAVLVGTGTFWEGVDVPGASLRCVVIDKLPFAPPGDPVVESRIKAIRDRGGDPFAEYQVPEAVLSLRQGVGRLLRRGDDYGVVALLDHRVVSRSYGALFRKSLPPMRWTREIDDVEMLFRRFRGPIVSGPEGGEANDP